MRRFLAWLVRRRLMQASLPDARRLFVYSLVHRWCCGSVAHELRRRWGAPAGHRDREDRAQRRRHFDRLLRAAMTGDGWDMGEP